MAQRLEARLLLRVGALRDSSLQRVFRGTVDAARKSSDQMAKAQRRAAVDGEKATRENIDKAKKALLEKEQTATGIARRELKVVKQAEEGKRREAIRTARQKEREAERTARAIQRAEGRARRESERTARKQVQDAQRSARRIRETVRRREEAARAESAKTRQAVMGGALGVGAGLVGGAALVARRAQAMSGAADPDEQLRIAALVDDKLIRATNQAGAPQRKEAIKADLVKSSIGNQIPQEELALGVQSTQERYAKFLQTFTGMLDDFGAAAQATEANVSALMLATGATMQAGGMTSKKDARFVLEKIVATSNQGAVSVDDFAGPMAPIMGLHAMNSGVQGREWVAEFNALAQQLGQSGARPDQIGTLINQFGERLNDPEVRKRLKKHGVETTVDGSAKGQLLPEREIIANMQRQRDALLVPGVLKEITQADESARAFKMAFQPGAENFAALEKSTGGREFIDRTRDALVASPQGRLRQAGFDAQGVTTRTGAETMEAATPISAALTRWQAANPIAARVAGPAAGILGLGGLGALGAKLFGGGAAATAGGAAAGGGLLAGLSGVAGGIGSALGLGLAGTAGLVGATGGALTAGTYYAADASGFHDFIGQQLFDLLGQRAEDKAGAPPTSAPAGGAAQAAAQEAQQKAAEQAAATQTSLADATAAMDRAAVKLEDARVRVEMTISPEGKPTVKGMTSQGGVQANVMLGRTGAAL